MSLGQDRALFGGLLSEDARLPVSIDGFLNQTEMPNAYAVADGLVLPADFGEERAAEGTMAAFNFVTSKPAIFK